MSNKYKSNLNANKSRKKQYIWNDIFEKFMLTKSEIFMVNKKEIKFLPIAATTRVQLKKFKLKFTYLYTANL